jgi:transcriptional regulator with XRE-family HTH domain
MPSIKQVLKAWPGSLRSLAREAGVAHVTLIRIRRGIHQPSDDTLSRVREAFERVRKQCAQAVHDLDQRKGD